MVHSAKKHVMIFRLLHVIVAVLKVVSALMDMWSMIMETAEAVVLVSYVVHTGKYGSTLI